MGPLPLSSLLSSLSLPILLFFIFLTFTDCLSFSQSSHRLRSSMPLVHHCITRRFSFLFLALCLVAISTDFGTAMRQQAVAVRGQLLCGTRPASGVKVKLWDEDDGPDPDDVLDEAFTDGSGSFNLKGSTRELTTIDPVLKLYHDCDDGIMPGQRKVKLRIPNQYITNGGLARRTFDVGVLNLETIFAGEERDLF